MQLILSIIGILAAIGIAGAAAVWLFAALMEHIYFADEKKEDN